MDTQAQKKAVIYCRVSTKEQVEEGNSLATQERNCREYALKHNYEIAAVFIEEGESAKTVDRTELKKLFAYCASKKNSISAVIAYKIDRISRNTDDYSQIRIMLRKYGVEIRSTSEHFEDSPAGRFMENIIANVAQFDNDVRAERCAGGMRDAVREGRYVWMAPYGYSNVQVNGKATIAPNQFASYVLKAFEEVASQTYPISVIRKKLIGQGMVTATGKTLSQSQFYAMLRNELYTGWITKFGETHRGLFEPLISEGLFQTVQQIFCGKLQKYPLRKKENPDFPLRRFFTHPSGRLMTGAWSKGKSRKYPYYFFHNCNINFRKEVLESVFEGWLNQFKLDIDHLDKLFADIKRHTQDRMISTVLKPEDFSKKIEALKSKQSLLIDKNLDGVISNELAKEKIAEIETEIYSLKQYLKNSPDSPIDFVQLLNLTKAFLQNPGDTWANAGIEEKIKLQRFYFPHGIEIDKNESRTLKICNLFKVKGRFSSSLSYNVHHSNSKSNSYGWQILRIEEENNDEPVSMEEIQEELLKLSAILNSSTHKDYLMQRA